LKCSYFKGFSLVRLSAAGTQNTIKQHHVNAPC